MVDGKSCQNVIIDDTYNRLEMPINQGNIIPMELLLFRKQGILLLEARCENDVYIRKTGSREMGHFR